MLTRTRRCGRQAATPRRRQCSLWTSGFAGAGQWAFAVVRAEDRAHYRESFGCHSAVMTVAPQFSAHCGPHRDDDLMSKLSWLYVGFSVQNIRNHSRLRRRSYIEQAGNVMAFGFDHIKQRVSATAVVRARLGKVKTASTTGVNPAS